MDLTGKQFGAWRVLRFDESSYGKKHRRWICKCECGTERSVLMDTLLNGRSASCGCKHHGVKGQNKTHGMSKTRIYAEWCAIKTRCISQTKKNKKHYADKGITVCNEWKRDFLAFYTWAMENGYSDELTIDRIDNNKGYSPDNCRWATYTEQCHNRSNTVKILYNGEYVPLAAVCKELNVPYKAAISKVYYLKSKSKPLTVENVIYSCRAYKNK
ncbi:MAG: hypothetical protein J6A30_09365 [Ruminococcus sp.]|nr:hypothetical protein [Ruminococcus sp.]